MGAETTSLAGHVSETLARNAVTARQSAGDARRRISASGRPGPGRRCSKRCAPFAIGLAELGVKRGDKVAIIGANRPRLYWAMCAAQALGAVPVPVYADSVADEMAYRARPTPSVALAVVEDQEQVDKMLSIAERLPRLEKIVYDETARAARLRPRAPAVASTSDRRRPRRARGDPKARRSGSTRRSRRGKGSDTCGHALHVRHHRPVRRA